MAEKKQDRKFVVQSSAIGGALPGRQTLTEGRVCSESELEKAGGDVNRLLRIGAIRQATEADKNTEEMRIFIEENAELADPANPVTATQLANRAAQAEQVLNEPPASMGPHGTVPHPLNRTIEGAEGHDDEDRPPEGFGPKADPESAAASAVVVAGAQPGDEDDFLAGSPPSTQATRGRKSKD